MPKKGTLEYYAECKASNTRLRSHLLKNLTKLPNESARQWLTRGYGIYMKQKSQDAE